MPTGAAASNAVGNEGARSCSGLVSELLNYVGASGTKAELRAKAILNQSVADFNADKLWMDRFLKADIPLAADTATFPLPARWAGDRGYAWLLDTDGERFLAVKFLPFTDFLKVVPNTRTASSQARYFTIENRVDSGSIEIFPEMSAASFALYPELRVFYFADIPGCSAGSDTLQVSGALENAIFDNALWRLNLLLGSTSKEALFRAQAEFSRRRARKYDNRLRLRIGPLAGFK